MDNILLVGQSGFEQEGFRLLIAEAGYRVTTVGADEILEKCRLNDSHDVRVVLVDASAPDPVTLCRSLVELMSGVTVVALINQDDADLVRHLGAAGVAGIIDRRRRHAAVMTQLELVVLGEKVAPTTYLEESYTRVPKPIAASNALTERLSNREQTVASCLSKGMANKVIARQLGLSEPTVKVHVKAILRKLRVHNRTEAALCVASQEAYAA